MLNKASNSLFQYLRDIYQVVSFGKVSDVYGVQYQADVPFARLDGW